MPKTHRKHIVAATLLAAFMLSACGVRGDLQTPPPLWGDKAKAETADKKDDAKN